VLLAAPAIRAFSLRLTQEEGGSQTGRPAWKSASKSE
jgi:hypothetical protein